MSDKFLNTGGSNTNITNGTATLFGSTIGAISLDPSQPIKTNSVRQLVSSKLDIADITNLRSELTNINNTLDTTITNPFSGILEVDNLETNNNLTFNSASTGLIWGAATNQYLDEVTVGNLELKADTSLTLSSPNGVVVEGPLTFNKPAGEVYMENNTTETVISTINTWTKVLGTTTTNPGNYLLTAPTSNRLTYTGMVPKIFHTGATFSVNPSTNSNIGWSFGISLNGVHQMGSRVRIHTTTNGYFYSSAIHKFLLLNPGDYFELYCQNNTGTQNCIVNDMNLFALAVPNTINVIE